MDETLKLIKSMEKSLVPELFDFLKIIEFGARKYADLNWLDPDGKSADRKSMHASMFRHLAESSAIGDGALDHESGLDPLLHLATRALMTYTRRKRGLTHPLDRKDCK